MWFKTKDYLKHAWGAKERIDDRIRIGFLRCPKCRTSFGIYMDEFREDGKSIGSIMHAPCGFKASIELENWQKREADNRYH